MKAQIVKPFASYISKKINRSFADSVKNQKHILEILIKKAKDTEFGKKHEFENIHSYQDFVQQVGIKDYEGLKHYFDKTKDGHADILWPSKPKYLAKTSGTTSGIKYIPITRDSITNHIVSARNAILNYTFKKKDSSIFNGKMIFLSGSPQLAKVNGIHTGRLSGIVNHEIPSWVKGNQLPTYETNCIADWETKLYHIVKETSNQDLRLISGIPPWVQMYFERLIDYTGKQTIKEIFPNLSLFVYGGVNYEPYRNTIERLIGATIDSIETYPASEGFIAYQDEVKNNGLRLITDSGIFYEFVPLNEIHNSNPTRLTLADVDLDTDYAILITSNAGLWAYNLGDTVRFVSKDPCKIIVSGRIKHFISAFGEHVIAKEVELALSKISHQLDLEINEFTVAPMINPPEGKLPYHEWLIEFDKYPSDSRRIASLLDLEMIKQNIYYKDLIEGQILSPLKVTCLRKGTFQKYMDSRGKLGGQNKVPRLSNDRKIAESLIEQEAKSVN